MSLNHEALLQEEINRLEYQLKSFREKQWDKEKEWLKENKELQDDITRLQALLQKTSQPEVFRMIKGNLLTLQDEIEKLREEQKEGGATSSSASPSFSSSNLAWGSGEGVNPFRYIGERAEDRYAALAAVPPLNAEETNASMDRCHDSIAFSPSRMKSSAAAAGGLSRDVLSNYRKTMDENVKLRADLESAKQKVRLLDSLLDEKNVECRELQVKVATLQKQVTDGCLRSHSTESVSPTGRSSSANNLSKNQHKHIGTAALLEEEVKQLRNALAHSQGTSQDFQRRCEDLSCHSRALQNEINYLRAQLDKKNSTEEERTPRGHSKDIFKKMARDNEEAYSYEQGGSRGGRPSSAEPFFFLDAFCQLSKDRRDCLDELMRQLEQQWAIEDPYNSHTYCFHLPMGQSIVCPAVVESPACPPSAISSTPRFSSSNIAGSPTEKSGHPKEERLLPDRGSRRLSSDPQQKRKGKKSKKGEVDQLSDPKGLPEVEGEDNAEKRPYKDDELEGPYEKKWKRKETVLKPASSRSPSSSYRRSEVGCRSPPIMLPEDQVEEHLILSRKHSSSPTSGVAVENGRDLREAAPEGAHLRVTVIQLEALRRQGRTLTTGDGEIFIKLKSFKEKYKTSLRPFTTPVVHFGEAFQFYLAQPHQDVISLHVYFKSHSAPPREYHIGDCCFSLATLFKGIPRERRAPIVENAATPMAVTSGIITIQLQTDDFGVPRIPSAKEIADERLRFEKRVQLYQKYAPEKLHTVDVFMATEPVPNMLL